ncbi:hypothetical protein [Vibrio harveyi]|uniref:hypothetical protein n=1 Tax=Vibrio harveyi TaxID=669 RepID=UPI00131B51B4|nr:hypothetical protein [Vibrio harveyi]
MSSMCRHHPNWRFGQNANIAWIPKFFYGGSKHHNLPSDRDWIFKHLELLSEDNQKIASEEYEQIFLSFHNKGEFRKARYEANKFLQDFTNSHYATGKPMQPAENKTDHNKLGKKIAQVRKTQRDSRPRIIT